MKKCFLGCLIAAAILAAPWSGAVNAAIVPLSDLLAEGATIQSGDKIFSDFTYLKTGDMPAAEQVNVETIQDGEGDHGIRIQGGFVDQAGGDASDALITFNVSVPVASGLLISGAKLSSNPAVFAGDPSSLASVTETFIPTIIDNKLVVYDFGEGDDKLLDQITFAQGYATLPVQKDIILHAIGDTGAVTMSFVDQTFAQVPEPSGLLLALAGLLGLAGIRRRRA
jgi:MYXO-CTERM domain-containing protein